MTKEKCQFGMCFCAHTFIITYNRPQPILCYMTVSLQCVTSAVLNGVKGQLTLGFHRDVSQSAVLQPLWELRFQRRLSTTSSDTSWLWHADLCVWVSQRVPASGRMAPKPACSCGSVLSCTSKVVTRSQKTMLKRKNVPRLEKMGRLFCLTKRPDLCLKTEYKLLFI